MYHQIMTTIIWIHIHDVIDDVTRSQNRSKLKLIYLRQYLSCSVDQKLKMLEMLMAIFLVYSTSGITSGKKSLSRAQNGGHFENFEILNTASIWPQIWKDRLKLCQKKVFFMVMTSSMTSQGGLTVSLYIHVYERLAPGANCTGNVWSINANIVIVFLGYTYQKTISMNYTFRDCRSKVNITGLPGDLGTNKQHFKLSQIHLFLWSSKSFTLPQPANHLFIKINLLHGICTKNSHVCCGLCW